MSNCPHCGFQRFEDEKKCPHCDEYYSKIDEFLAEEEAKDEQYAFKTRLKRAMQSGDCKQAFKEELMQTYQSLPKGSLFALYLVLTIVFASMLVVI